MVKFYAITASVGAHAHRRMTVDLAELKVHSGERQLSVPDGVATEFHCRIARQARNFQAQGRVATGLLEPPPDHPMH